MAVVSPAGLVEFVEAGKAPVWDKASPEHWVAWFPDGECYRITHKALIKPGTVRIDGIRDADAWRSRPRRASFKLFAGEEIPVMQKVDGPR